MLINQQTPTFQEQQSSSPQLQPSLRQPNQNEFSPQQMIPKFEPVIERHQGVSLQPKVYPQFKPIKSSSFFGLKPSSNNTKGNSGKKSFKYKKMLF